MKNVYWIKINLFFLIGMIFAIILLGLALGNSLGKKSATDRYSARCMKYFGNKGYPNDFYCKLFLGEIKARDE